MQEKTDQVWREILGIAEESLPKGAADIWLKTCLPVSLEGKVLTLDVPNVFVREQIQSRFIEKLTALSSQRGWPTRFLEVGGAKKTDQAGRADSREAERPRNGLNRLPVRLLRGGRPTDSPTPQPAVAEAPGRLQPPFFWGASASVDHLLHAVGNCARHNEG